MVSRTPRIAQPDEFFPLASEEMIRRGAISDAVEHCRRGLIFYPDNISGYAVLANAYLLLKEPTRAANVLRDGFRRTGADRLLELADLLQTEEMPSESMPSIEAPVDEQDVAGRPITVDEAAGAEEPAEDSPTPSTIVEEKRSPIENLSHTDTREQRAEEQATNEQDAGQIEPVGLSFITDDPSGPHYVEDPADEAADLYPYGSDERDDDGYDEDLTDRMIARSDESLFGNAVGPISRDLFTGEPLPSERSLFQSDEEEQGEEMEDLREIDEDTAEEDDRGVDLIPPVKDVLVPAPDAEFSIGEPDRGNPLIPPAPTRNAEPEVENVEGKPEDAELGAQEAIDESVETGEVGEAEDELVARVVRPEDPTAGMAAGEGRSETGDLADLIDEGSDRMLDEGERGSSPGLSLHSGTQISDLRSRNLRLIPGLEYAPLRKDEGSMKIAPLVDERKHFGMPPLADRISSPLSGNPEMSNPEEEGSDSSDLGQTDEKSDLTPLEELARRLETARIPAVEEAPEEEEPSSFEPSLVSDTFAGILVSQGAYAEAIKAYQMLARLKPERREEYEKKIAEVRWQMGRVEN